MEAATSPGWPEKSPGAGAAARRLPGGRGSLRCRSVGRKRAVAALAAGGGHGPAGHRQLVGRRKYGGRQSRRSRKSAVARRGLSATPRHREKRAGPSAQSAPFLARGENWQKRPWAAKASGSLCHASKMSWPALYRALRWTIIGRSLQNRVRFLQPAMGSSLGVVADHRCCAELLIPAIHGSFLRGLPRLRTSSIPHGATRDLRGAGCCHDRQPSPSGRAGARSTPGARALRAGSKPSRPGGRERTAVIPIPRLCCHAQSRGRPQTHQRPPHRRAQRDLLLMQSKAFAGEGSLNGAGFPPALPHWVVPIAYEGTFFGSTTRSDTGPRGRFRLYWTPGFALSALRPSRSTASPWACKSPPLLRGLGARLLKGRLGGPANHGKPAAKAEAGAMLLMIASRRHPGRDGARLFLDDWRTLLLQPAFSYSLPQSKAAVVCGF